MKYAVLALFLCVATTLAVRSEVEYRSAFLNFMHAHSKTYSHDAFRVKYSNFKANIDIIDANNALNNGLTLGVTKFADLTGAEFKALYTGYRAKAAAARNVVADSTISVDIPTSVDWRTKGAVTPVKNQGQCGSCWSFSSTGSLEGLHFLSKGSLLSFSEQQLVDCSQSYGNDGCDGGLMDYAFQYVESQGIELESVYPYTAEDGTCAYKASSVVFKNTGYTDVTSNNVKAFMTAIALQPVSVAVEADQPAWQLYSSGVVKATTCGTQLDHGVLAVGYGTYQGSDTYIVKNSWGADWGMNGYILLERTAKNDAGTCGIQMEPSYPTA
jgi:cathepsin L